MQTKETIRFFDYPKLLAPYKDYLMGELDKSLSDGIYVNGPSVSRFEQEFAEYTGAKYAVGVSSGTDGLLAILMSLDLPKGSDVLVPSYTFIASSEAILVAGLNPIFVDNAPGSFHPSVKEFKEAWTENTKAVMFVHLFGETKSIKELNNFCKSRGAFLFEDAAESFGSYYPEGGHSGTHSLAASFSFFPAKTLGCLGDGGIVITNSEETYNKIKMIRAHGSKKRYYHETIGGNLRLDALQARFLTVLLNGASDEWLKRRQKNAQYYFDNIKNPRVKLPYPTDTIDNHSWYLYTLIVEGRDELQKSLSDVGVETFVYWPIPLHKQPIYQKIFGDQSLPECEKRCKEVLHIPVSPHLTENELKTIITCINEFKK
jgi:dTDP-4-amino-4,6-dideoxygalactose transaminase